MEILQAIILGIIEGLTEFLPISSTGHLVVAEEVMNYKDSAEIFTVVVQMGAIAAVIWYYRLDLMTRIKGLVGGDKKEKNFFLIWTIATIPPLFAGYLLKDKLSVIAVARTVAITLIVGGIIIWLIETYFKVKKSVDKAALDKISKKQALQIGLYQVLALVPGTSRSGATIMGGLVSGLDRVTATAFSFYLSIPVILLAGGYQLVKGRNDFDTVAGGGTALIFGTIVAFITALLAVKWLLKYVSKNNFKSFAYYRVILGVIILIFVV